jgi:hypothetical protein
MDRPGLEPRRGKVYISSSETVQNGSETQLASYSVGTGIISPGAKQQRSKMYCSSPYSEEGKNVWSYTSVSPVWLLGVARGKFLTYLITYAMEQSPSWEANWFSPCQEIPRILWNPKVHYRIHKCTSLVPMVSKLPFIFSGAICDKHLQSVCLRFDRSVGKHCDNGQCVVCFV